MSITISLVHNRRKKVDSEPKPIEIYIYQSNPRLKKYLSTGISVTTEQWNNKISEVQKHSNAPHMNKILRNALISLKDMAYSLQAKGQHLTSEKISSFLKGSSASNDSFVDFFKREIDPNLKRGTRKEHQYTYNLLEEYSPNLVFSQINYSFVTGFDKFLRYEKGLKQNTIFKHHQHINRFIRLASLQELLDESKNPYKNFKSKKEKSDRISLSIDELLRIENMQTDRAYPELSVIKDMFLFSCYTGLRFSDVISLERKHLVESSDGVCVVKRMEKVPKPINLPIALLFDAKPLEILRRYTGNPVFPTITNQHANRQLKVIATIAKIPMRLTFHIARHTFGSMLADITHNPYLIMDLMGHSDIKTSMIYIHRSQERINRQLRGVKWV